MTAGCFRPGYVWSDAVGWHPAGAAGSNAWHGQKTPVQHDPNYDLVGPSKTASRGIQCGVCGMKFDHNQAYGYCCGNTRCPVQPTIT